jgi:double-stranded uracil-DNA glycosylase
MTRIYSFPPLIDQQSRILILGSMPGNDSLRLQQYYANPRNAFWPIMLQLYKSTPDISYSKRCELLLGNAIAVWDVIGSCIRPSSLDANIDEQSININNFQHLFARYPAITHILFNGSKAEQTFVRYVQPKLVRTARTLLYMQRLPSTSPANASYSLTAKLMTWSKALQSAHCGN